MPNRFRPLALLLLAGAVALPMDARAQNPEDEPVALDPVVVTATRAPRPVSSIPGSVIVIDREQIEQQLSISRDPTSLLSKYIPGFSASNQTISGASETFRGRSVQVLVDGVSRNTPLRDSSRILALIDLNQVERIEVVNGASGIYGNGATGGIVNIITKEAQDGAPTLGVDLGLRAFTTDVEDSLAPEGSVSLSGKTAGIDYLAVVSGQMTQDTFDGAGDRLPDDPLIGQGSFSNSENYNGFVKLGGDFGPRRLQATAEIVRFEQDPDFFTDYTGDVARPDFDDSYDGKSVREDSNYESLVFTDREFLLGNLSIKGFRNDIEKRFGDAQPSPLNQFVFFSGDPSDPVNEDGQTTQEADQLGVRATVDTPLDMILDGLGVTWGFDYTFDETTQEFQDGTEAIAPMRQHSYAGFLQAELALLDRIQLRGGVRYERFDLRVDDFTRPSYAIFDSTGTTFLGAIPETEVFGGDSSYDETVFNLGAVFFLNDEVEIFAGFSQGFSLPDVGAFTRRAGTEDLLNVPASVDFSDIAPEAQVVDNFEGGFRGDWGSFRATVSAYLSKSDLGTNFDADTNTVVQQEEEIYGVEAVAEVDLAEGLTLGSVVSWREGKRDTDDDGDLDANLPNNRIGPPLRVTGYVDYTTDFGLNLLFEAVYTGSRNEDDGSQPNSNDDKVRIDPTLTFNAAATYQILGGRMSLGVENLLDVEYENPTASATRNFPTNGFGRVVSLRFSRRF